MTVKTMQVVISGPEVADSVALSEAIEQVALRVRHGQREGVLDMVAMDGSGITRYLWAVAVHEVQE